MQTIGLQRLVQVLLYSFVSPLLVNAQQLNG